MNTEPFFQYIDTMKELFERLDFARLRAYEIKGQMTGEHSEDPTQRKRQIKASIDVEIKQLQADVLQAVTRLEKIKNTQALPYEFEKK